MTWPQLVVLLVIVLATVRDVWAIGVDRNVHAGAAAVYIGLFLVWRIAFAAILSAGGFW